MSRPLFPGTNGNQDRVVLVLQGDQVFWFRWKKTKLLSTFVEPVNFDPLNRRIQCPWLRLEDEQADLSIELVLDTPLDELDRVSLEKPGVGLAKRWQCYRLQRSLSREFPCATVRLISGEAALGDLNVLHHVIPEFWSPWLEQLQQQNVRLTRVVTGTELLLSCLPRREDSTLLVTNVGFEERHLLVSGSAPVFMRMASVTSRPPCAAGKREAKADSSANTPLFEALSEELAAQTLLPVKAVCEVREQGHLVMAGQELTEDKHREHKTRVFGRDRPLPGERGNDRRTGFNQLLVNDAACRDSDIDPQLQQAELQKSIEFISADLRLPVQNLKVLRPLVDWSSPSREYSDARALATLCMGMQMNFSVNCADGRLAGPHVLRSWPVSRRSWRVGQGLSVARTLLQPSIDKALFFKRLVFLQRATLACALLACTTVVLASAHGLRNARQNAALLNEESQMKQQIVELRHAVQGLHQSPEYLAESMRLIQSHKASIPVSASGVMSIVAQAITRFPALELNSISWSVMNNGLSLETSFVSAGRVEPRRELWGSRAVRNHVQLEMAGVVVSGSRLRDQHDTLMAFVAYLESVPQIAEVRVLESPVQSAQSSERAMQEEPGYRLALRLSAS